MAGAAFGRIPAGQPIFVARFSLGHSQGRDPAHISAQAS